MILVTKIPQEGVPYQVALNKNNIVEVSPRDSNESWLKFWDGQQIRNYRIKENPKYFVKEYTK